MAFLNLYQWWQQGLIHDGVSRWRWINCRVVIDGCGVIGVIAG
jgi:hypothetical protein